VKAEYWRQAMRFDGKDAAGRAYDCVQEAIRTGQNDLSVYRAVVSGGWYVLVLGVAPEAELARVIEGCLGEGTAGELPEGLWQALEKRRRQTIRAGTWTERHYGLHETT